MLKSGFLYWISLKATQVFTTATWLTELCATSKAFRFFVKPGVWYSNLKLVLCLYWMKSCLAASCESVGIYVELEIIQVLVSLASARTCRDQKMTIIPHKKKRQSLISPTKNVNEGIEFQHIWVIFNVRMNVGRSCVSLSDMGDAKDGVNDTAWWWLAISSFFWPPISLAVELIPSDLCWLMPYQELNRHDNCTLLEIAKFQSPETYDNTSFRQLNVIKVTPLCSSHPKLMIATANTSIVHVVTSQILQRASVKAKVESPNMLMEKEWKTPHKGSGSKSDWSFGVSLNNWKNQSHCKVKVQKTCHNHQPLKAEIDLPFRRRLEDKDKGRIWMCKEANVCPWTIQSILPGQSALWPIQDIYN